MKEPLKSITVSQAFDAMRVSFDEYYKRTGSDDVGALLGVQGSAEGETLDPAAWSDWVRCVTFANGR